MAFDYKDWYRKNREALSEKRKRLYREDPERRARILEASNRGRNERRARNQVEIPEHMVGLGNAAETLGLSPETILAWKAKGYFPEPQKYGRKYYFTSNQVSLLARIRDHFQKYPRKAAKNHTEELQAEVLLIQHNWS